MISFKPLWKTLIDKEMKKQDLATRVGITNKTVSMMARNKPISMKLLDAICRELGCQVQDVIEYIPDEEMPD